VVVLRFFNSIRFLIRFFIDNQILNDLYSKKLKFIYTCIGRYCQKQKYCLFLNSLDISSASITDFVTIFQINFYIKLSRSNCLQIRCYDTSKKIQETSYTVFMASNNTKFAIV
jgi:hypothetical protein